MREQAQWVAELVPILSRALGIYETGMELVGPEPVSYTKDEVIYVLGEAVARALIAVTIHSAKND